jgi:hypothetical protein
MFESLQYWQMQIELWRKRRKAAGKWRPADDPEADAHQMIEDLDCLAKRAGRALQYPETPGDPSPCD